jgi:hypothetical protein
VNLEEGWDLRVCRAYFSDGKWIVGCLDFHLTKKLREEVYIHRYISGVVQVGEFGNLISLSFAYLERSN